MDDKIKRDLFRANIATLIRRRAMRQRFLAEGLETWVRKPLPESITRWLDPYVEIRR